jgi:hypothetical protein
MRVRIKDMDAEAQKAILETLQKKKRELIAQGKTEEADDVDMQYFVVEQSETKEE